MAALIENLQSLKLYCRILRCAPSQDRLRDIPIYNHSLFESNHAHHTGKINNDFDFLIRLRFDFQDFTRAVRNLFTIKTDNSKFDGVKNGGLLKKCIQQRVFLIMKTIMQCRPRPPWQKSPLRSGPSSAPPGPTHLLHPLS